MDKKQLLITAGMNGNTAAVDSLLEMIHDDLFRKVTAAAGGKRAPALTAAVECTIRDNFSYLRKADGFDQWVDEIINLSVKESPEPQPVQTPASGQSNMMKFIIPGVLVCGILIGALVFFLLSKGMSGSNTAANTPEPSLAAETAEPAFNKTEAPEKTEEAAEEEETPAAEQPAAEETPAPDDDLEVVNVATDVSEKPDFYYIPDSATRLLTEADIIGFTAKEMTYARNEIYARHGHIFKAAELRVYFNQQSWYHEDPNWNDNNLAGIELQNAIFIRDYQYAHGMMYDPK